MTMTGPKPIRQTSGQHNVAALHSLDHLNADHFDKRTTLHLIRAFWSIPDADRRQALFDEVMAAAAEANNDNTG